MIDSKRNILLIASFLLFLFIIVVLFFVIQTKPKQQTTSTSRLFLNDVQISSGFMYDESAQTSYYSGVVNKVIKTKNSSDDVLSLDIQDTSGKNYTFLFSKFFSIADITDPHSGVTTWTSSTVNDAIKKIVVGTNISIKFDPPSLIRSTNDISNKEEAAQKSIIIYDYLK